MNERYLKNILFVIERSTGADAGPIRHDDSRLNDVVTISECDDNVAKDAIIEYR